MAPHSTGLLFPGEMISTLALPDSKLSAGPGGGKPNLPDPALPGCTVGHQVLLGAMDLRPLGELLEKLLRSVFTRTRETFPPAA